MWKWDWSRFCAGVEIACGIVIGLLCVLASLAFVFSFSGCTNAVLEGPDGATEDVGVSVEPLTFTTINSNNGQALNDSSCKLTYLRGYVMQECPFANCWSCAGDTCTKVNTPSRTWVAKSCVDINTNGDRRCELRVLDGGGIVNMFRGFMMYNTQCQHDPLPKASLLYQTAGATTPPTQRVFNQPFNRLETF